MPGKRSKTRLLRPRRGGRQRSDQPRVLIAEDHGDSRDALSTLLEAHGYSVLIAVNGHEAIRKACDEDPDLILMDIMMPKMDGIHAMRYLRRECGMIRKPIIATTAMDNAHEVALNAGASDYVPKPLDFDLLLNKLEAWLVPAGS